MTLEQIEALARTEALDALVLPLEVGLADLPEVRATAEGAARLKNGNPGMVMASDVDYGDDGLGQSIRASRSPWGSTGRGNFIPTGCSTFNPYRLRASLRPSWKA